MAKQMTMAEKAAAFDRAVADGHIVLLEDFTSTLEARLIKQVALREPVWTNDLTGNMASSVCAAFGALDAETLHHAIRTGRFGNQETTWTNPETGKVAASVAVVFHSMGFRLSRWSKVRKAAETLPSFHLRHDRRRPFYKRGMNLTGGYGTVCLDLEDMETVIHLAAPRKGPKAIAAFLAA